MNWTLAVTLIVQVISVLGALITAAVAYRFSQESVRRGSRAKSFAEALNAVEEFTVMPYRIRRRPGGSEVRHEISVELDKVQSRIAFQLGWLQIEAVEVARRYEELVAAARREAGAQMREAWGMPPAGADENMTLGAAYPRTETDEARDRCIEAMRAALNNRNG